MLTELIGWAAATVLLATICRQVYTQWRERSTGGVSKWLFVGQLVASTLFVIYSALLGNWVFVVTNALLLLAALVGELIYLRNRRRGGRDSAGRTAARAQNG
jgi:MtN3 and saliva related transmembrane protein